jgi:hypothetical protein
MCTKSSCRRLEAADLMAVQRRRLQMGGNEGAVFFRLGEAIFACWLRAGRGPATLVTLMGDVGTCA